jgi:opacity protein-like surface antigen
MKKLFIAAGAILFAFSSNAFAAENTPYIEVHAGAVMPRDIEVDGTIANVAFTGTISEKEREAFGGEIGVANISGTGFRAAASAVYFKQHLEELCVDGGACAAATDRLDNVIYMGRVYYDFVSDSPLTPYVGFGAGLSDLEGTGTDLAWSAVLGVNYAITNNVYLGIRGEYIYAYTKDSSNEGGGTVINSDGQDHFAGAIVLGFRF